MAASELFSKANEAFVSEDYEEAIKLYTSAIEGDGSKDEYYANRAQARIKLGQFTEAVEDTTKAIAINPKSSKAFLRKGIACFNLDQFDKAKEAFVEGQKVDESEKSYGTWIRKCEAELDLQEKKAGGNTMANVGVSSSPTKSAETEEPRKPKYKHDWYQTETMVIVTVMIKNAKKEDVDVDIQDTSLSVTVKLSAGSEYNLELNLAHSVVPEKCITKVLTSKIEIKMKKAEGIHWGKLEGEGKEPEVKQFTPAAAASDAANKYPSSSHYTRDWDKLVVEIKEEEKNEKLEGDAALNQLFQQIYSDGSDEVRKAMNKSFSESGGTVLSTNWGEIGDKKTEIKPPDGMEYKKW